MSQVAPEVICENEPILANEAISQKGPRGSRDFGGRRIRGIFVFAEHKVSFMFQFRACFNFGRSERWEWGLRGVSRALV